MNRRAAIKNFVIVGTGLALIPSCAQKDSSKPSIALKNLPITGTQEKMLAELAETIIPTTATSGSKALASHLFVMKMVDDCYDRQAREDFINGMEKFEKYAKKKYKAPFTELNPTQKTEMIALMDYRDGISGLIDTFQQDVPQEAQAFYSEVKKLTIQSFVTSKYFLMDVRNFKMAPGYYKGCVPVSKKA